MCEAQGIHHRVTNSRRSLALLGVVAGSFSPSDSSRSGPTRIDHTDSHNKRNSADRVPLISSCVLAQHRRTAAVIVGNDLLLARLRKVIGVLGPCEMASFLTGEMSKQFCVQRPFALRPFLPGSFTSGANSPKLRYSSARRLRIFISASSPSRAAF
jgi:hypothetical protein